MKYCPQEFTWAQAIFHRIPLTSSQYSYNILSCHPNLSLIFRSVLFTKSITYIAHKTKKGKTLDKFETLPSCLHCITNAFYRTTHCKCGKAATQRLSDTNITDANLTDAYHTVLANSLHRKSYYDR